MPVNALSDIWIDHEHFKDMVEQVLHKNGYEVVREPNNSGFHMRVKKDNEHSLVRCKSWAPMRPIDQWDLIQFHGHMKNVGLSTGWFICISDFTFEAYNYGQNNKIVLVDGESLQNILKENGFSLLDMETGGRV